MSKKIFVALVLGISLAANAQVAVAPTQPAALVQATCAPTDQACATKNQQAGAIYQTAMSNYNTQLQQYQSYQTAQAQAAAAAAAQEAALAAANRAQQKNEQGSKAYGSSQMICTAVSMALAGVCMTPTGQWACAPSAMFGMLAGMAGGQKSSHEASKYDACTTANKISTVPANCGSPPAPYNPGGYPANTTNLLTGTFDPAGKCIGTQAQCQAILDNLPPGTNIKDVNNGLSQFASGKGPYSVNPDGSIKMKNGKTYGVGAFDSKQAMMDAGLTAAQADAMMGMLAKQKALGDLDAKGALAKESGTGSGDSLAGGGGSGAKPGDGAANGDASGSGKDLGKGNRSLASEGLTKDFNGELIGAAGDDIFKMMNRRYRLKNTQDSFLTIKP